MILISLPFLKINNVLVKIRKKEGYMSIVKIIEVICEGATFDAALKNGIEEASKTVENIKQINVEHIEGLVDSNKITKVRVNAKISFVVDHNK